VTVFARRERDVIDWVRDTPAERWRTSNVHRLQTRGLEVAARRQVGVDGTIDLQYAWLDSEGDAVAALSKYVLDYARHRVVGSLAVALPGRFGAGGRLGFTRRVDGREYALFDLRVSRDLGSARLFLEGVNLLDTEYQEIIGVEMPGRSFRVGLEVLRF
jgi:outer membrane cobalamin receptor